jgi:hypothetical protein
LADYKLPSIVEIKWMTANIFFSELTQSGGLKKYASLVPHRVAADLISDEDRRKYHATEHCMTLYPPRAAFWITSVYFVTSL